MKRLIALLLIAAVLFTLAACGKKDNSVAVKDSVQAATEAAQNAEAAAQAEAEPAPEQSSGPVDDGSAAAETEPSLLDESVFQQINSATGANISRPTVVPVDHEEYTTLMENNAEIAQYIFLSGSVNCGVRFCADTSVDISGVADENGENPFLASSEEVVNLGGALISRWATDEGQYVLIATTEDEEQFRLLLDEMRNITAG